MTLWIAIIALTLTALGALLLPMFYRPVSLRPRREYDLRVFNDQLAEVDRDIEFGILSPDQGEAVRLEIRRRMLQAASVQNETTSNDRRTHTVVAIIVAVTVPIASFALYRVMGSPHIPDQPFSEAQATRIGSSGHDVAVIQAMVDKLALRLKTDPNDPGGWLMLGRSYRTLGRNNDAVDALRKAASQAPKEAVVWSALGESLAAASEGMIVPEAREALLTALRLDPKESRARFYLALARAQIGDAKGAIAVWKDLEADSPPNAPWLEQVRKGIAEMASQNSIDPSTIDPKEEMALAGTATPTSATTEKNPPIDQKTIDQRVESLAARLEKSPNDAAGWAMLGRSYRALGKNTEAQQAYVKAMKLAPRDVTVRLAYAETLITTVGSDDRLPDPFVAVMREVLSIDQDQADALYYVGLAEVQAGRNKEAKPYWQRLLASLPKGGREYQQLEQEIKSLK